MEKSEKYGILIVIALVIGLGTFWLLKYNRVDMKKAGMISLLPVVLTIVVGIIIIEKDEKEKFSETDGCTQNINIYQQCGGKNTPSPPSPPTDLLKDDIEKWIGSVDSGLTSLCKSCVVSSALKLWKKIDLMKVQAIPLDKQKLVLQAMLVMDCDKECVIKPVGLEKAQILAWLAQLAPPLPAGCRDCLVDTILKLWSVSDFQKTVAHPKEEQIHIVQALVALNCKDCDKGIPGNIPAGEVEKWLNGILGGSNVSCLDCVIKTIYRIWKLPEFEKVQKMDKKSQDQIVQALIALNCEKDCIEVPSGVTKSEAMVWISSLTGAKNLDSSCMNCSVQAVMKNWSPSMLANVVKKSEPEQLLILTALQAFNCEKVCSSASSLSSDDAKAWIDSVGLSSLSPACVACAVQAVVKLWKLKMLQDVKAKPKPEQQNILSALIASNCGSVCAPPPPATLNLGMIQGWLNKLFPELPAICTGCIAESGMKMWSMEQFRELTAKGCDEQRKIIKLMADFNCPHACDMSSIEKCSGEK